MLRVRSHHPLVRTLAVALVVGLSGGCRDEADKPDLTGTYDLVSLTLPGESTLTSPAVTGTLILSGTSYSVDIAFTVPDQIPLLDSGSYALDGTGWTQTSNSGGGSATGTWVYESGELTLDVTSTEGRTISVWAFVS